MTTSKQHRKKHFMRRTAEYSIWTNMKTRCNNKNNYKYKAYGGRGITLCQEWQNSFQDFYEDMGPRPGKEYSIDRIDNNKGYYKENCRWATNKQQANNQRSNRKFDFNGEILTLKQISEIVNIDYKLLHNRINKLGWDLERALTTELRQKKVLTNG